MLTYWDIATGKPLLFLCAIGLIVIVGLILITMRKAWGRALELGIKKEVLKKVAVSSVTFSIVPSISIVVGLITLSAVLGTGWSWFRLSVVGAVSYELMAADMVAQGMNYSSLSLLKDTPGEVMIAVMIVMSVCIISGIIGCVLMVKKITTSMNAYSKKSGVWGTIVVGTFMITMITVLVIVQASSGLVATLTILTSIAVAFILTKIAENAKFAWISEFILSITLIVSMASSVLWQNIFI
ncbi:MAG: DUF5058 family protein [Clostridioides sp.]|jgi:hypothetical protein|nr:DUF5058 family protein [Clostridioides sp.]